MTTDQHSQDVPLCPAEASTHLFERWGLKRSVRTLQTYRRDGTGPQFHRTGNDVRYTKRALDAWAAQRLGEPVNSTSERSARRLMAPASTKQG